MKLPRHLAIIMDGNGRWAQARGHNRFFGHIRGARLAKQTIEECARQGLPYLTLFAFSTENWFRPQSEVSFLMKLLSRQLKKERANLQANNIRFRCIGEISRLPEAVRLEVEKTVSETANNTGMTLVFALSYGGKQEIVEAVKSLASQVQKGELAPEEINDQMIRSQFSSQFLPDPDLIVRTSGESRLSNFFLWQAAYSEIYICEKFWPEFDTQELNKAFEYYAGRKRRFGRTEEQIQESNSSEPLNARAPDLTP